MQGNTGHKVPVRGNAANVLEYVDPHSAWTMTMARLEFASDYMEGCIPEILTRLTETNLEKSSGYGSDEHTARAAELIREACDRSRR